MLRISRTICGESPQTELCAGLCQEGGQTFMTKSHQVWLLVLLVCVVSLAANAQTFKLQCPSTTTLHPGQSSDQGAIKCQQISGGDGFATMADGTQTYLF